MQQNTLKKACLLRTQRLKVKTAQRDLTTGSKCQVKPKSLCLGHEFFDTAPGSWFSLLLEEKVHLEDIRLHKPEHISWLSRFSTLDRHFALFQIIPAPKARGMGRDIAWRSFPVWMPSVCIVNVSFFPLAQQWSLPLLFAIWVCVWTCSPLTHSNFQCSHNNANRRRQPQKADF